MSHTRSLFRNSALASGLLTKEQLETAIAELLAEPPTPEEGGGVSMLGEVRDQTLADKLIQIGRITKFQADQLLNGRTKFNLGKYLITDFIGHGGMGDVFKAEHDLMGREVAVKVLTRPRSTPEAEANFQREIRLQAKLDHPNLVRAYDAGHDGNVYYLVVEYVPGTDLRRLVRTQGKLDMQQAATVIMHAAQGLAHAHLQGLIHRDVKPGNLLVTPEGFTKVSDLGLAGFMDEGRNDPRAGKIVGTADYISPEVYRSPTAVSPLSDIYSLGCTLYYAVTGKVPYPGGTTREKLERHCHDSPLHPWRLNESVSEEFVEVIADMMEKNPAQRVQSAEEVAERLAVWARETGPVPARMRSTWAASPLPADSDEPSDTGELSSEQSSQALQGTAPISRQDTQSPHPPLPKHASSSALGRQSGWPQVILTAAIAVPISLCIGALVMWLFLTLLQQ